MMHPPGTKRGSFKTPTINSDHQKPRGLPPAGHRGPVGALRGLPTHTVCCHAARGNTYMPQEIPAHLGTSNKTKPPRSLCILGHCTGRTQASGYARSCGCDPSTASSLTAGWPRGAAWGAEEDPKRCWQEPLVRCAQSLTEMFAAHCRAVSSDTNVKMMFC